MAERRKILRRSVKVPQATAPGVSKHWLCLCMLGCEDHPPYGPTEATAALFIEVVCEAILLSASLSTPAADSSKELIDFEVSIAIYRVQVQDYPADSAEWDAFDGFLIPGSFSSAYETTDWIELLKEVIQTEIFAKKRKTLAVCFGHQLYSHSFEGEGGLCTPCPAGHQAGRRASVATQEGKALLNLSLLDGSHVELMYTHGDMVKILPSCAVLLFGNDKVPIQAAAYFADEQEARMFREKCASSDGSGREDLPKPHAITFQAHPEYSCEDGLVITFANILTALGERKALPESELSEELKDTRKQFPILQKHSIRLMVDVGRTFGWFK